MDWSLILLSIVLLIVAYFMYLYLTGSANTAVQNTYMKTQLAPIPITNYSSPNSNQSAYSFWLFVNKLESNTTTVFTLEEPSSATPPLLSMVIDSSSKLQIGFGPNTYVVTENFPLQKWERIDISFDNNTMDVYLSGKLLRSFKLPNKLTPSTNANIKFGAIDAYISGFKRQSSAMDPSTAWSAYLAGNQSFVGSMPTYGVTVELTKDAVSQKRVNLI
jgi:hypothetical protein